VWNNLVLQEHAWDRVQVFMEKPKGKRPLGKTRRRWEDNIKIDLKEIVVCCVD
jgi:hypothetical protein